MARASKTRASKLGYTSQTQLTLEGFETPFSQKLNPNNRWVKMNKLLDWDSLVAGYLKKLKNHQTGASSINPRGVIGSLIIKHHCKLTDEETVMQIQENMYMQYFLGFSSYSNEPPFDSSLFVEFRKRLSLSDVLELTERISGVEPLDSIVEVDLESAGLKHQGDLLLDATVCPQHITYPTDLDLLNTCREKTESLIDSLRTELQSAPPRIYKEKARKHYLIVAQSKRKTKKSLRKAIRQQLQYVRRNIHIIHQYLDRYQTIPFSRVAYKDFLVLQTLYEQQSYMYQNKTHTVADRIVSISQPHVRPMVRGKKTQNVEFGAKINVSLVNGFAYIERLSWDAFNEGTEMLNCIKNYVRKFKVLPKRILADKIYCNRANRQLIKDYGIELRAKPLGRPSKAMSNHVSPGERNPIEGKFGEAKTRYGLGLIQAKLKNTSETWIALNILVLNLANLSRRVLLWFYFILKYKNNQGLLFQ
jgi:IS5 family transposase